MKTCLLALLCTQAAVEMGEDVAAPTKKARWLRACFVDYCAVVRFCFPSEGMRYSYCLLASRSPGSVVFGPNNSTTAFNQHGAHESDTAEAT